MTSKQTSGNPPKGCPMCGGTGRGLIPEFGKESKCFKCNGLGVVEDKPKEDLDKKLEREIDNGEFQ